MGKARTAVKKRKRTPIKRTAPKKTVKTKPNKKNAQKAVKPSKAKNIRKTLEESGVLTDADIDFCGISLKGRLHAFLSYYLTPGQYCFHNARQAAIKAGYAESTASVIIYGILKKPEIQKIISANENLATHSLHEAAKKAIEIMKLRAFYKPKDFIEIKSVTDRLGRVKRKVLLKDIKEMPDELQYCIDGVDIKQSEPVYILPDRKKELSDIIKLDAEYSKSTGGSEEEETREIIMERITIREAKRAQRPANIAYEIMEDPVEVAKEDE